MCSKKVLISLDCEKSLKSTICESIIPLEEIKLTLTITHNWMKSSKRISPEPVRSNLRKRIPIIRSEIRNPKNEETNCQKTSNRWFETIYCHKTKYVNDIKLFAWFIRQYIPIKQSMLMIVIIANRKKSMINKGYGFSTIDQKNLLEFSKKINLSDAFLNVNQRCVIIHAS